MQVRRKVRTYYTAFGLTMKGILSHQASTSLQNKDKTFQGQKFDDDLGVNYYSFKYRNHDPQIGRFIEIDPLASDYEYNSTYAFSENKVISHIELEGLEAIPAPILFPLMPRPASSTKSEHTPSLYDGWISLKNDIQNLSTQATTAVIASIATAYVLLTENNSDQKSDTKPNNKANNDSEDKVSNKEKSNNKLEADKRADGDHSTFKRDNNGDIYKYQDWLQNDKNPNGFDAGKRFDGGKPDGSKGKAHIDKKTGKSIETPHVNEKGGNARNPLPNEIPNNNRF